MARSFGMLAQRGIPSRQLGGSVRAAASASGTASSTSSGVEEAEVRVFVYFACFPDWCDHLLLHEGGTFEQGAFRGSGSWALTRRTQDGQAVLELELLWTDGRDAGKCQVLVSTADQAGAFSAADARMAHVGGDRLEAAPAATTLQERQTAASAPTKAAPRALLFSSVGSQCLPVVRDHWLAAPSVMEFDVALMFYKEASSSVLRDLGALAQQHSTVVEVQHSPGMKWPNFIKWMEANGGPAALASRYDYVWVVDDDVRLATAEINRMFAILREHSNIMFACPSFDAGSDGVWRYFDGHDPRYKLRYTDFVECTAPILNTCMLEDPGFARCLRAVRTGCFIDFCFFPAAGRREDAVAIIDAVQCHHPPRGPNAPSEMRQVKRWEDHKEDDVFFDEAGVPRDWYWFRQPKVFRGIPADATPSPPAARWPASTQPPLSMPLLGMGTAFYPEDHALGPEGEVVGKAVAAAVRAGVRLFDCANQYTSQPHVGAALQRLIREGVVRREEIVVVAKLARFGSRDEVALETARALSDLQMDFVDVLMPHIPPPLAAWQWFEAEVDAGRALHLGVSNYDQLGARGVPALKELLQAARVRPEVHQFELHPLLQNAEMVDCCREEDIQILSYSPLGAPHKVRKYLDGARSQLAPDELARRQVELSVLDHPAVQGVARLRGVSPAMLVLRWHIENGFVPIPKSWNLGHIAANGPPSIESFGLSEPEMAVLDSMDAGVRTVVLYQKGRRGEL